MLKKHIILIGMRGAGKTFYAKRIAKRLQVPFVDTDARIQNFSGMSVQEMVEKFGWDYFRDREYEVLKKSLEGSPGVIALGGGAPIFERNQHLLQDAYVIWVFSPLKSILHYLLSRQSSHRPALTNQTPEEEIRAVYQEREPVYQELAEYVLYAENPLEEELNRLIIQLKQAQII